MGMQASLADEEKAAPGPVRPPAWLSAAQTASAQQGAGLRNATGEYNCFLNVIIQCLWHCSCFRCAVMQWLPHAYQVSKSSNWLKHSSRILHASFPHVVAGVIQVLGHTTMHG